MNVSYAEVWFRQLVELQIPMFRKVDDQWTSSKVSMNLHTSWIIDTVVLDIVACTVIGAISQAVHLRS